MIDKKKSPLDDLDPAEEYVANAAEAPNGRFYAIWAAPGMRIDYVYDTEGPERFDDIKSAEAKARLVLFNALNHDLWVEKEERRQKSK